MEWKFIQILTIIYKKLIINKTDKIYYFVIGYITIKYKIFSRQGLTIFLSKR